MFLDCFSFFFVVNTVNLVLADCCFEKISMDSSVMDYFDKFL